MLAKLVVVAAEVLVCCAGCAATGPSISIPTGELAARFTALPPAVLTAWVTKPAGDGPFPAIIFLHGCSGLQGDANTTRVLAGYAAHFRDRGWVTLILDSFGPRSVSSNCFEHTKDPREVARAIDAYAALTYLTRQRYVDARRVVLWGLSQGGTTVLRALDERMFGAEGLARGSMRNERFAAGIAYYPNCEAAMTLQFYAPVLVLIGDRDEWMTASTCPGLHPYSAAERRGTQVVVYPGVHHAFDYPIGRVVTSFGTLEGNIAVASDAQRRADRFLEENVRP